MKITIKRRDLDKVSADIKALATIPCKNTAMVVIDLEKKVIKLIEETLVHKVPEQNELTQAYSAEVNQVYNSHLYKDNEGKVLYDDKGKPRIKNIEVLNKDMNAVAKKHPEAVEQIKKHEEDYNIILDQDVEIETIDISFKNLSDSLTAEHISLIKQYFETDKKLGN